METELKQYNKFMKTFHLDHKTAASEEIFKYIYINKKITLNSFIVSLKKNKQDFNDFLIELMKKQYAFYKEEMYSGSWECIRNNTYSISDASIMLDEDFNKNAVPIIGVCSCSKYSNSLCKHEVNNFNDCKNIELLDIFLSDFAVKMSELDAYVDKSLHILCKSNSNSNNFKNIIDEAKKNYFEFKGNYCDMPQETENTYAHFYILLRNNYISNFYINKYSYWISFEDLNFASMSYETKQNYSLRYAAEVYSKLDKKSVPQKVYDNMKKQFQKSLAIQKYKGENGNYFFPKIEIPLAHYHYYKKKNRSIEQDIEMFGNSIYLGNHLFHRRIVPIFELYLSKKNDLIKILQEYLTFVIEELNEIFSSLNWHYQLAIFDFLRETILNIYAQLIGMDPYIFYK